MLYPRFLSSGISFSISVVLPDSDFLAIQIIGVFFYHVFFTTKALSPHRALSSYFLLSFVSSG